jgi:hypothetical protein
MTKKLCQFRMKNNSLLKNLYRDFKKFSNEKNRLILKLHDYITRNI